jgi:hypothetical protein
MISNRYPEADALAQQGYWDKTTRDVILDRVHNVPAFRFFNEHEVRILLALCERVIPQSHRPEDKRVPIAPWIDQRCRDRTIDGSRFDNMPPNEIAWRQGLQGIDQASEIVFNASFDNLSTDQQDQVLRSIAGGEPRGEVWQDLPAKRFWIYIAVRQIAGIYYAHPFAWDEIGFGGPAYPRGYASLNNGAREPWESREVQEAIQS